MTETLAKAWSLFDAGNYTDAETLYKECYAKIPSAGPGIPASSLSRLLSWVYSVVYLTLP